MAAQDLPIEVLRFIEERVEGVPHLEVLLMLWQSGIEWSATEMAKRVYLKEAATQSVLLDLRRTKLAASRDGIRFSYDGGWDETQVLMKKVAQAYQHNLTRVATLIHQRASSPVREFARAFDLKKEG